MKQKVNQEPEPTLVGYIATSDEINALKKELTKGRIGVFLNKGDLIAVLLGKKIKKKEELKIVKVEANEKKVFNEVGGKFCIKGESQIIEFQSYNEVTEEALAEVA
jgi:hypothetical protein